MKPNHENRSKSVSFYDFSKIISLLNLVPGPYEWFGQKKYCFSTKAKKISDSKQLLIWTVFWASGILVLIVFLTVKKYRKYQSLSATYDKKLNQNLQIIMKTRQPWVAWPCRVDHTSLADISYVISHSLFPRKEF